MQNVFTQNTNCFLHTQKKNGEEEEEQHKNILLANCYPTKYNIKIPPSSHHTSLMVRTWKRFWNLRISEFQDFRNGSEQQKCSTTMMITINVNSLMNSNTRYPCAENRDQENMYAEQLWNVLWMKTGFSIVLNDVLELLFDDWGWDDFGDLNWMSLFRIWIGMMIK